MTVNEINENNNTHNDDDDKIIIRMTRGFLVNAGMIGLKLILTYSPLVYSSRKNSSAHEDVKEPASEWEGQGVGYVGGVCERW